MVKLGMAAREREKKKDAEPEYISDVGSIQAHIHIRGPGYHAPVIIKRAKELIRRWTEPLTTHSIFARNDATGGEGYIHVKDAKNISALTDIPSVSYEEAKRKGLLNIDAPEGHRQTQARYKSSTTGAGWEDKEVRKRGGDPGEKLPKTDGWGSDEERDATLSPEESKEDDGYVPPQEREDGLMF